MSNFLNKLKKLTEETGIAISGCGCCGSPYLLKGVKGSYKMVPDGEHPGSFEFIKDSPSDVTDPLGAEAPQIDLGKQFMETLDQLLGVLFENNQDYAYSLAEHLKAIESERVMVERPAPPPSSKAIFKMELDFRRGGSLEGIFVRDKEDVEILLSKKILVRFGEVLGKHSDVCVSLTPSEITMVSDDPAAVKLFLDNKLYSGSNPFYQQVGDYASLTEEIKDPSRDEMDVDEVVSRYRGLHA